MTTILLMGLLVPFILITDIFPFFRFGMFAEPIKQNIQTEKFILYVTDSLNHRSTFDPLTIGINPNTFHYLCRNYYYRNESKLFAEKIILSSPKRIKEIEFFRTISTEKKIDTFKIGRYKSYEK